MVYWCNYDVWRLATRWFKTAHLFAYFVWVFAENTHTSVRTSARVREQLTTSAQLWSFGVKRWSCRAGLTELSCAVFNESGSDS